jgi:hypothetical protein
MYAFDIKPPLSGAGSMLFFADYEEVTAKESMLTLRAFCECCIGVLAFPSKGREHCVTGREHFA